MKRYLTFVYWLMICVLAFVMSRVGWTLLDKAGGGSWDSYEQIYADVVSVVTWTTIWAVIRHRRTFSVWCVGGLLSPVVGSFYFFPATPFALPIVFGYFWVTFPVGLVTGTLGYGISLLFRRHQEEMENSSTKKGPGFWRMDRNAGRWNFRRRRPTLHQWVYTSVLAVIMSVFGHLLFGVFTARTFVGFEIVGAHCASIATWTVILSRVNGRHFSAWVWAGSLSPFLGALFIWPLLPSGMSGSLPNPYGILVDLGLLLCVCPVGIVTGMLAYKISLFYPRSGSGGGGSMAQGQDEIFPPDGRGCDLLGSSASLHSMCWMGQKS